MLENISKDYETSIYVKRDDQLTDGYAGNKLRKLEFLIGDFFHKREKEKYECIITFGGSGSNHAVATSYCAKKFNIPLFLLLENQPKSFYVSINLILSGIFYDAHIIPCNISNNLEKEKTILQIAKEYGKPYVIPLGGSSPAGLLGFVDAGLELLLQVVDMKVVPTKIYISLGTTGTCLGLLFAKELFLKLCLIKKIKTTPDIYKKIEEIKIVGVMTNNISIEEYEDRLIKLFDELKAFLVSLDSGFADYTFSDIKKSLIFDSLFKNLPYGQSNEEIENTIVLFEKNERIYLDAVYTGKVATAMLSDVKKTAKPDKKRDIFILADLFW